MTWPKARAQAQVQRHLRRILLPSLPWLLLHPRSQSPSFLDQLQQGLTLGHVTPCLQVLSGSLQKQRQGLVGQVQPFGLGPHWPRQGCLLSARAAGTASRCPCSLPVLGLCTSRCLCLECLSLIFPGQFLQLVRTHTVLPMSSGLLDVVPCGPPNCIVEELLSTLGRENGG